MFFVFDYCCLRFVNYCWSLEVAFGVDGIFAYLHELIFVSFL